MRIPNRNRCRQGVFALCLALILITAPSAALSAQYDVFPNGTMYHAAIEVVDTDKYSFFEPGSLGEDVAIDVKNISVQNESGDVEYKEVRKSEISFPKGNYTIRYVAPLSGNYIQAIYDQPYDAFLHLPEGYYVGNPLLGRISHGGEVYGGEGNLTVKWENTRFIECRFYDAMQERLIFIFGTFWVAIFVIFLVPYISVRRKKK